MTVQGGEEVNTMDYRKDIERYILDEIALLKTLDVDAINEVMNLFVRTKDANKTIYIFGNGGSAATASHYQNDFNKGISEYIDTKFRFHCLNDNVATMLAIANDIGYEEIFRFQLDGRIQSGDIVVAISGSGNSKNVINAVQYAKEQGNEVVGIYGLGGGKLKALADYHLEAKTNSMVLTEDIHMVFDHMMFAIFLKTMCSIDHFTQYVK